MEQRGRGAVRGSSVFDVRFVMGLGAYKPSRHQQLLGWGVGLIAAGIGLFSVLIVFLAIGAFDQWHIQSDAQLSVAFSAPVLIVVIGLTLVIVGLVKAINAFRARK
jgi:dipeptide/tripeptide permease